jgi:radical SAM protein with 4Fe4S-binding SPASM domain
VRVNSVITKANVADILETWQGAVEELKCDSYTPSLYSPTSSDEAVYGDLLPDMTQLLKEQERVMSYSKTFPRVVTVGSQFRFSCGIANGEIGVSYDGSVYPCHLLHKPELKCGNLRVDRIGKILKKSGLIAKLRAFNINDIEECRLCDFKHLCGGGCLAMTYNMYGNFYQTNNFYCRYLKQEYIERMWHETVSELKNKAG